MYNWENYDNDIAYSYDDYVEQQIEQEEDIDNVLEEEKIESLEYQSKMAEQMMESVNGLN